jgi:Xaa-Pro aminopeptidase
VIDLRTEARRHDQLLERRLDVLVPKLLDEAAIDCWVLIGREYAEDPVLATMLPAEWLSARRRTILVLTPTDRFAVARYPVGSLFRAEWDPGAEPDQWRRLAAILEDMDPAAIGIGTSTHQAHADGLTVSEHAQLLDALPPTLADRLVSAGTLGIRWLETRLPEERALLSEAAATAHGILRTALSAEVIIPGVTTTDDVVWWLRQRVHDAGLGSWFQPSVSTQRASDPEPVAGFAGRPSTTTIGPGDLIHVDFGIVHHGLCTDQQEHAYVLRPGEEEAPAGLTEGLRAANRAQDILMSEFRSGRSGNEILAAALAETSSEGLDATIYTHSIGVHGHGAGMTIGLWDRQDGVPGQGDHPLHPDTAYSIELMVEQPVPEWDGKVVRFMVEQDAWFDGGACQWLDGRQDQLWLI